MFFICFTAASEDLLCTGSIMSGTYFPPVSGSGTRWESSQACLGYRFVFSRCENLAYFTIAVGSFRSCIFLTRNSQSGFFDKFADLSFVSCDCGAKKVRRVLHKLFQRGAFHGEYGVNEFGADFVVRDYDGVCLRVVGEVSGVREGLRGCRDNALNGKFRADT